MPRPLRTYSLMMVLTLGLLYFSLHPSIALAATQSANHPSETEQTACIELIRHGTFETISTDWAIAGSPSPAQYSRQQTFNGSGQAIQLGIIDGQNVEGTSSITQTLLLPAGAESIILSFRYYPLHEPEPGDADIQYVDLQASHTNHFITRFLNGLRNDQEWRFFQKELAPYAGNEVHLVFATDNDGEGGRTAMYIDNVSIEACGGSIVEAATPAPVDTPTPQATAIPPTQAPIATQPPAPQATPAPISNGCENLIRQGQFENQSKAICGANVPNGWCIGQDPILPDYVTDAPNHSGGRAVRLGNAPGTAGDVASYSSIRQRVYLPPNPETRSFELRWQQLLKSEEPIIGQAPSRQEDRQEIVLLRDDLSTIAVIHRVRENNEGWSSASINIKEQIDINPLRGTHFYLYFNTYNDGDGARTWMYLDNVELIACPLKPQVPPTQVPPTQVPPTQIPPTQVPPTQVPPTQTPTIVPTETPTAVAAEISVQIDPTSVIVQIPAQNPMSSPTEIIPTEISPTRTAPTATARAGAQGDVARSSMPTATALPTKTPIIPVGPPKAEQATPEPATEATFIPSATNSWTSRLGVIAVLASIIVLIGSIATAILLLFNKNRS